MSEIAQPSKSLGGTTLLDLVLDVTTAAGIGEPAEIAVTVHLPDPKLLKPNPVVCFGKPGTLYSRRYYTLDLPGPARGSQSQWHVSRGWVFVAVDHLGVGDSSKHDGPKLNFTTVTAANQSAEEQVLQRLQDGTLLAGYPSIVNPVKIGLGQSMGGSLVIVQQGRYHGYDGVGILGFSAVHTVLPPKPGSPPLISHWWPRDRPNDVPIQHLPPGAAAEQDFMLGMSYAFHYDDIDPEIVAFDMGRYLRAMIPASTSETEVENPPWASLTAPLQVAQLGQTPGVVAPEAAAIMAPILLAVGERDVLPDPKGEARAYQSASSIDLFICPKMAHMHNFASTRELFWRRIEIWADWVRETKRDRAESS